MVKVLFRSEEPYRDNRYISDVPGREPSRLPFKAARKSPGRVKSGPDLSHPQADLTQIGEKHGFAFLLILMARLHARVRARSSSQMKNSANC